MLLPAFTLHHDFSAPIGAPELAQGVFQAGASALRVSQQGFDTIIETDTDDGRYVVVLGSPIINNRVDREYATKLLLASKNIADTIRDFNGEFLAILYDQGAQRLRVITDRYSSYPAFWAQQGDEFALSYNYMDIAKHVRDWPGFKLRPEKAYEFFTLQRLLGTDTHDNKTQCLPPATILRIEQGKAPEFETYWVPDYTKNTRASEKQLINEFDSLFGQAVRTRLGDDTQSTAIFLSGGHDSRLVAAYADKKTTCYTLSFRDNLEVDVAREIAKICGHDHIYSELSPTFFQDTLDITVPLNAALYTIDHALFINKGMTPVPQSDVILHGHGLDFMYQGMYLHARYYQLFGRNTTIKHFVPMPSDLPDHFMRAMPFRLKHDYAPYLKDTAFSDSVKTTVDQIYNRACDLSDEPMDQLEYMIFHNPSRHYTFSNVLSKRMCAELRTPSFDNDLYRFYQSLPFKYRLHANMMRGAMYKVNPKIANLKAANHALPAGWGPYSKTAMLLARKIARHATLNQCFKGPWGSDRTWPDRDDYFRDHEPYRAAAWAPLQDTAFKDFMSFIDWDALERDQEAMMEQKLYGAFLVTLLSYYRFYKELER